MNLHITFITFAWIMASLLIPAPAAKAQDGKPPVPIPQVTKAEWERLRAVTEALVTKEGAQKLYVKHPKLGEVYTSEDHFAEYLARWRPRLINLPPTPQEAESVEVDIKRDGYGATTCRLTFHHQQPPNAITIMKTVWQDESLLNLVFLKGFSQVVFDNSSRYRWNQWEGSYRRWNTNPSTPNYSNGRK